MVGNLKSEKKGRIIMEYVIVAVVSFIAGAVLMFVYHKKIIAEIDRTKN